MSYYQTSKPRPGRTTVRPGFFVFLATGFSWQLAALLPGSSQAVHYKSWLHAARDIEGIFADEAQEACRMHVDGGELRQLAGNNIRRKRKKLPQRTQRKKKGSEALLT